MSTIIVLLISVTRILFVSSLKYNSLLNGPFQRQATAMTTMLKASSIKEQLVVDMKAALKAREKCKLDTIRSIQAALKKKEIDDKAETTDEVAIGILSKLLKQRKESIRSYTEGGRSDLVELEVHECEIISNYLPKPLTVNEINNIISNAISTVGASSVKDMGKVMGRIRPLLLGRADMSLIGGLVKEKLNEPTQ